jgi:hypothetical protein
MVQQDMQFKPKYISFKINGRKQQDKRTTTNAIRFHINQEIKFLYKNTKLKLLKTNATIKIRLY